MYSAALGQFDLSDFGTVFSTVVFVIFTLLVLVLLFHALIALVVDSYAKTQAGSQRRKNCGGGQARLIYVAELGAHRRLMLREWSLLQYCAALLFLLSSSVLFLFAAAEIRDTVDDYYGYAVLGVGTAVLLVFLLASVAAFVSHMTYYDFHNEGTRQSCTSKILSHGAVSFLASPVLFAMRFLMGIRYVDNLKSKEKVNAFRGLNGKWDGSAAHVKSDVGQMIAVSESQMTASMRDEIDGLELRFKKISDWSKADVLTEIRASEERVEIMLDEIRTLLTISSNRPTTIRGARGTLDGEDEDDLHGTTAGGELDKRR